MQQQIYVFDSRLANAAAEAVESGEYRSILEYHHTNSHGYTRQPPPIQMLTQHQHQPQHHHHHHQQQQQQQQLHQQQQPQHQPQHHLHHQQQQHQQQQQQQQHPTIVSPQQRLDRDFRPPSKSPSISSLPSVQIASTSSSPINQVRYIDSPAQTSIAPLLIQSTQSQMLPSQVSPQTTTLSNQHQQQPQTQPIVLSSPNNNNNNNTLQEVINANNHVTTITTTASITTTAELHIQTNQQSNLPTSKPKIQKHSICSQTTAINNVQVSPKSHSKQLEFRPPSKSPSISSLPSVQIASTSSSPINQVRYLDSPIQTSIAPLSVQSTQSQVSPSQVSPPAHNNHHQQQQQTQPIVLSSPKNTQPELAVSNNNHATSITTTSTNTHTELHIQTNQQSNLPTSKPKIQKHSICSQTTVVNGQVSPKSHSKQQISPDSVVKTTNLKNKVSRRRSSERRESLREGLMRTLDFVIALKDLKHDHPSLWRITGNNLLQQFEPKKKDNIVLYENTNHYAGWNSDIKKEYVGVDVKLTQHTRNQITVERLSLNVQKSQNADAFYHKHFAIYIQILVNTVLDPKFWEGLEQDKVRDHYDYFTTSRKIIDDLTSRYKKKLSSKWKLDASTVRQIEKYPKLSIENITKTEQDKICRACNTNFAAEYITFGNITYDLNSLETVKLSEESLMIDKIEQRIPLCLDCDHFVVTYSELHHFRWRLFDIVRKKISILASKGLSFKEILDDCFKDKEWLSTIYTKRDGLWSKVEGLVHD